MWLGARLAIAVFQGNTLHVYLMNIANAFVMEVKPYESVRQHDEKANKSPKARGPRFVKL